MQSLRNLALAGATALALAPAAARGADMPAPPMFRAPIVEDYGAWYLRGDIGMTNQRVGHLDNVLFDSTVVVHEKVFDSSPLFGIGLGYKFNNWLRFDGTAEYRGGATFSGFDTYTFNNGLDPAFTRMNDYRAVKSEWLFLANAYLDLGTWHSVTPFVGAGIGGSRNTISGFRDMDPTGCPPAIAPCTGPTGPSAAFANSASKWNFAWALHAGLSYQVTPNFTVELAYRYVDLGSAQSGDIIGFDGTNAIFNPMLFKHLTSNDLKLGVRWMFADNFFPSYEPPLIRKY
jgi:opacity protein-like surface antigen